MLRVKNDADDIRGLFQADRQIVLYGAGASAKLILQAFYGKGLKERIAFAVDKNDALDGTSCRVTDGISVPVISLSRFLETYGDTVKSRFIILITPFAALRIVEELDRISQLDGAEAYLYALITDKKSPAPFSLQSLDSPAIPRRIHYIWIGEKPMPQGDVANIESWKRYCPGYEIIRWDEKSYDFGRNRYTREAYRAKQYMYATDYVRKDILYRYGGIYLDTDVELIKPLDALLYNEAFIGIEDGGQLNSGSGLGAVAGHPMMQELMEVYEEERFVNEDGSYNLQYNTWYETRHMLSRGYELKNRYQKINGLVCLPKEVLMPESTVGLYDTYTENTVSNHKIDPFDKSGVRKVLKRIYEAEP